MEWSSIVDAPTFVGDRAETLAYLTRRSDQEPCPSCGYDPTAARLDRADKQGTSSKEAGWGHGWDSRGALFNQRGYLPRARFEAFARAAAADDEPAMLALLDPLDR